MPTVPAKAASPAWSTRKLDSNETLRRQGNKLICLNLLQSFSIF
jgi:hypothetical protein